MYADFFFEIVDFFQFELQLFFGHKFSLEFAATDAFDCEENSGWFFLELGFLLLFG
jgi:hypothetical protein